MGAAPTSTMTFLFTDIEGSTQMWEQHAASMQTALARHDEILREAIESSGGAVLKHTGDGVLAVFGAAEGAVAAAIGVQRALAAEPWGETGPLLVRVGLHTGSAEQRGGDYFGPTLNRAARLTGVAHGGQILCSRATADLARDVLPPSVEIVELGAHRLRDLARADDVYQLSHPALRREFPPLRTLEAFPGNLPTQRTDLIGRERELAKLTDLIETHRLVTLTGVGGVGKTRLALQLAAATVDRFADGAWFVPLATVREPELVPGAVAAVLEVPERAGRSVVACLCDAIGTRELLVVLDNCEHVLGAAAGLVDVLLDRCPRLRILATSREALGVDGEQGWPTPSLATPDLEATPTLEDVATAESVRLFVERARAVRPVFELTADNASAVAAICARLDGIPLAIELAAARVSALSPHDILSRIDERFRLLTGGSRTALERHQTLQATVDWSYDLLSDAERRFFDRVSVFVGGFTLEAAHAVAADSGTDVVAVVDLLASLIGKSMIIADGGGASLRYRLLETLRQYGRDRLASDGEADAVRDRHAAYFLAFAEQLEPDYFGPDELAARDRYLIELDNARAAFDWLLERGAAQLAVRFMRTIGGGWQDTGEALRRNDRALAVIASLPAADRIAPLAVAGFHAMNAGALTHATELCEESLACAVSARVPPDPTAYAGLGLAAFWANDPTRAIETVERGVAVARESDERSRSRPSRHALNSMLGLLCFVLGQTGHASRAIEAGEEAVAIARELGGPLELRQDLWQLALACQGTDPVRAGQLLDESLSMASGRWSMTNITALLAAGIVRTTLGDRRGALEALSETLTLSRQYGDRLLVPTSLQAFARVLRQAGRPKVAARMLAAAQAIADELTLRGGPVEIAARERAVARLRDQLGPETFTAEWEAGRALSFDEVVALVQHIAAELLGDDAERAVSGSS